jgi:hypothetical protein
LKPAALGACLALLAAGPARARTTEAPAPVAPSAVAPGTPAPAPAAWFDAPPPAESRVRRFENVFFISLPFTALYSAVLVAGSGLAIEGRRFTVRGPWLAAGIALPVLGSGWIAWRDQRRPDAAAIQSNSSPR